MVNSNASDGTRVGSGADRLTVESVPPQVSVELTPRGLELLETLNDLFDTLAASESGPEPACGNQGI